MKIRMKKTMALVMSLGIAASALPLSPLSLFPDTSITASAAEDWEYVYSADEFTEALAARRGKIKLMSDVQVYFSTYAEGEYIIDLNGNTLIADTVCSFRNADVTITSGSAEGTVAANGNAFSLREQSKLTVENCKVVSYQSSAVFVEFGSQFTVDGGAQVVSEADVAVSLEYLSDLCLKDGTIKGIDYAFSTSGGGIFNLVPFIDYYDSADNKLSLSNICEASCIRAVSQEWTEVSDINSFIEAVKHGGNVRLAEGINGETIPYGLQLEYDLNLDLNGQTLYTEEALRVTEAAYVNVIDQAGGGKLESYRSAMFCVEYGKLILDGCRVSCSGSCPAVWMTSADNGSNTVIENGAVVSSGHYNGIESDNASITYLLDGTVSGGTDAEDSSKKYDALNNWSLLEIDAGYRYYDQNGHSIDDERFEDVTTITSESKSEWAVPTTIGDFTEALRNGGKIRITDEIAAMDINDDLVINNNTVINLAGHNMTFSSRLSVNNDAEVTVCDSVGGGSIYNSKASVFDLYNGTVNVDNCTLKADCCTLHIFYDDAVVNVINGGAVISNESYGIESDTPDAFVFIKDGTVQGGEYYGDVKAAFNNTKVLCMSDGVDYFNENGDYINNLYWGYFSCITTNHPEFVGKIQCVSVDGGQPVFCTAQDELIGEIKHIAGDKANVYEITLEEDLQLDDTGFEFTGKVLFDLNGHKIYNYVINAPVITASKADADVTIENGKIETYAYGVATNGGAKLTLKKVKLSSQTTEVLDIKSSFDGIPKVVLGEGTVLNSNDSSATIDSSGYIIAEAISVEEGYAAYDADNNKIKLSSYAYTTYSGSLSVRTDKPEERKLAGYSLSFDGQVGVCLYIDPTAEEFSASRNGDHVELRNPEMRTIDGTDYLCVKYYMPAKNLSDTVIVTIDGKNYEVNAEGIAETVRDGDYGRYNNRLAAALLNYCNAAAGYFDSEKTAQFDGTVYGSREIEDYLYSFYENAPEYGKLDNSDEPLIEYVGSTLMLKENLRMRVYFKVLDEENYTNLQTQFDVYGRYNEWEYAVKPYMKDEEQKLYYIDLGMIPAAELSSTKYSIVFHDGRGNDNTLEVSPHDYIYKVISGSYDNELKAVCYSLEALHMAAIDYDAE